MSCGGENQKNSLHGLFFFARAATFLRVSPPVKFLLRKELSRVSHHSALLRRPVELGGEKCGLRSKDEIDVFYNRTERQRAWVESDRMTGGPPVRLLIDAVNDFFPDLRRDKSNSGSERELQVVFPQSLVSASGAVLLVNSSPSPSNHPGVRARRCLFS